MSHALAISYKPISTKNIKNNFLDISSESILKDFVSYVDAGKPTLETYLKGIRAFITYLKQNEIKAPVREDIINFRDSLRLTHKPATIKTYLAALRRFFSWTELKGIWGNICEGVKGVKLDKGFKKDCLTSGQARELLAGIDTSSIQGKRDYALLALMVTTGLRDIEVARARAEDIRVVGDFTVLFIQGKGRDEKSEYVKLSVPVEKAIRAWLAERGNFTASDALFCSLSNNSNGRELTTRSISRIVKDSMRRVGLESDRLTAHSLRHTAATLNLLAGGTLEETQQLLRHSSIVTTQIYAHNLDRMNNHSEIRISDKIFGQD